ncbi:MAG: hypothetical protein HYZ57_13060 [Acidobacteria bacterium]|nr:hypothetical protein [Acidobacteriota bacterium]
MPVNARRFIRKMRGGAQAHLLEADDGFYYVVKFRNNPQHRRVLINELVARSFLDYLQLPACPAAIIEVSSPFLTENPEISIQLGHGRLEVPAGWHFGSRFPGDPSRTAVYDFVPDALLEKVANARDFLGMLVFDKWMANADARQCVFLRARIREFAPVYADHPLREGFLAQMIDNGYVLNGPHWDFPDSPLQGLYFRPVVYGDVRGWNDFEPWLNRVVHFPESEIDRALKQVPPEWLEGDEAALESVMERLLVRRERVPDLIEACRKGRLNAFPKWAA